MTLTLGIDVGTSGIRTAVIDSAGNPVSMARTEHKPQVADAIDAELWWQSVVNCLGLQISTLRDQGLDPSEISGLAVDGTSGTVLLVDERLRPVTRALMYNSSGFESEARNIGRFAPPRHITRGPSSALARILHLLGEDSDDSARHIMHQADFIMARLLGVGGHSDFNNALKTGVDQETGSWPDWIPEAGIDRSLLPEVHHAGSALAQISGMIADELGLSRSVTVHAGTTDSIAAFLACTSPLPGAAVTSLGSTLVVKAISATRVDDPEIGLYSHRLGDCWLAGGASNTGGAVLARHFPGGELETLSAEIDTSRCTGLDYYPLLETGERFPVNDPNLSPRMTPRPDSDVEFLHGILEGMARIEALGYRAIMERGGDEPVTLYTAGGGVVNRVWKSIRENIMDMRISDAMHTEAAIGAARLAMPGWCDANQGQD